MTAHPPTTVAGFPTRVEQHRFGGLAVRVLVVDQLERFVDSEALLSDADAAEPPYWAHLWTASRVLAGLVAQRDDWTGKHVIDIGCGLGLPGIVAALRGAVVTAIDYAPQALAMTRANAELNGCAVTVVNGDLRRSPFAARFDFGLAADITYDPSLQRALAVFLDTHLSADGIAWCAESVRTIDPGFRRACVAQRLAVAESEVVESEEGHAVPVRVSEIRHNP